MTLLRNLILTLVVLLWIPAMQTQSVPAPSNVKTVQLTFTTIDVPGAEITGVFGINSAADLVGTYGPANTGFDQHGFLYRDGNFTYFDYPGAISTFGFGINDSGVMLGSAYMPGGLTGTGFFYDGTTFTPFRAPNKPITFAYGVNNAGAVVGSAGYAGADFRGFVLRSGRFIFFDLPGHSSIEAPSGINNLGQIAAYTISGTDHDAYLYKGGRFKKLDFPGADFTQAYGINDGSIVVGAYVVFPYAYGFAYKSGRYISFRHPDAISTTATAISKSGQIVGLYQLADYSLHGFVTSPITDADFQDPGK